jgi:hypothetical protein
MTEKPEQKAKPEVEHTASQPSNDSPLLTGIVLPPIDQADAFELLDWAIGRNKPLEVVKSLIEQT